jgi:hypothetical protein
MVTEVDSIEPAGGLVTGDTRVLVRGGMKNHVTGAKVPFDHLELAFPHPKCKFGRID